MSVLKKINIPSLTNDTGAVNVNVKDLNISFEHEHLSFVIEIVTSSIDPRIKEKRIIHALNVNNNNRIKVYNQDGTPSIVTVRDFDGSVIKDLIQPSEEILELDVDVDGNPSLNEDLTPRVDEDGNPVMKLIGYTDPVYQDRTEHETIGEFDFWVKEFPQLIASLNDAVMRNVDPTLANEVTYIKPIE